jgi:hypothetical protein
MTKASVASADLRAEYAREKLGAGARGRFYESWNTGHGLLLLDPAGAAVVRVDRSVNDASLSLVRIACATRPGPSSTGAAPRVAVSGTGRRRAGNGREGA